MEIANEAIDQRALLSGPAQPSGELMGPRAPLAPKAGCDEWPDRAVLAESVAVELVPPEFAGVSLDVPLEPALVEGEYVGSLGW
jgi:hypothetical protein